MYCMKHTHGRSLLRTTHRVFLGSLFALAACSGASTPGSSSENVGSSEQALLTAVCTYPIAGTTDITIGNGEIGYAGFKSGCVAGAGAGNTEPCVYFNAHDATGAVCTMNSVTGKLNVTPVGALAGHVEKMVLDFTNSLFGLNSAGTVLMNVTLDGAAGAVTAATPLSKIMVIAPAAGSNIAAGVNGIDLNALAARGATQYVDIAVSQGTGTADSVLFEIAGGAGADVITGDATAATGWATMPTGWSTAAVLSAALGGALANPLIVNGNAGNDTIAGGAGLYNDLYGGPGNDTFLEAIGTHPEVMFGGDGVDTVDYSARGAGHPLFLTPGSDTGLKVANVTVAVAGTGYAVNDVITVPAGSCSHGSTATFQVATVTAAPGVATLTVLNPGNNCAGVGLAVTDVTTPAAAGATLTLVAGTQYNDGEVGEADSISSDVEIVSGGAGNDTIDASGVTGTDVALLGNAGNDILIGASGAASTSDLCGGAGNDTLYYVAGNGVRNLSGGAGEDVADYSNSATVIACLNMADVAAGKTCATQNGGVATKKDVVNNTGLSKVCPHTPMLVQAGAGTASVAPTTAGATMAVDVEDLIGNATAANTLQCGTLACMVQGGSAADTIVGSLLADNIWGGGGGLDSVTGNGGDDLIDLTHAAGGPFVYPVNCGGAQVTVLMNSADQGGTEGGAGWVNCATANVP